MNIVLAITGPTGSGKTTVADKLAQHIDRCVNIDVDYVKHFIASGFIYDQSPAGVQQWKLLGENIGLLARNFLGAGYNVIINGYINAPACENIQKHVTFTHKLLLLPHIDVAVQRDAGRKEEVKMGVDAVKEHYSYFSGDRFYDDFTRVDTTNHSVEETIRSIFGLIKHE